ncbi:MAG: hypothetical protein ABI679_11745 [Gemmatimonadota bacterium]
MNRVPVKRWLGIDGVDLAIQAGVTVCVATLLTMAGNEHTGIPFLSITGLSLGILAIRRALARRRGDLDSPEVSGSYVLDLEHRVAELESNQQRMFEMEERIDFAERLLAQQRQPEQLP